MVLVVRESDKQILNRIDAWEEDSVGKMIRWAKENGYTLIKDEITMMGDMVIWVA